MQIENTIYASDPISGWDLYFKSHSKLHDAIMNGDIKQCINIINTENDTNKFIDVMTCLNITPLFMMLQYSVVNNYDECIYKLVETKIKHKTDFRDFLKNIEMARQYGDKYVNDMLSKLQKLIGDTSFNYVMKTKINKI